MKKIILFAFIAFLASCTSSNNNDEVNAETTLEAQFDGEDKFITKMEQIDNDTNLIYVNSLQYTHTDKSTQEAYAVVDEKQKIYKIEQKFSNSKTGVFGKNIFYFENNNRIVSKEIFFDNLRTKPCFIERITYYKNNKAFFTKERTAEFEENLEMNVFSMAKTVDCPSETATQILNQEGPFITTFQGFTDDGQMNYIIVGDYNDEGYTSALAVQHSEGDVAKLLKDQKHYLGKSLKINYERIMDDRGFEFQLLIAVNIL